MRQNLRKVTIRAWLSFIFILTFGSHYAAAQSTSPNPLFASDDMLKIRIEAPFKKLISKAKTSTDPYPGQLKLLEGNQNDYAITVAARGKSRRTAYCKFPPLRVKFDNHDQITGEFAGQKSLKLVTHCKNSGNYLEYLRLENGVYRMFNQLTPQSLKTRMVLIDYIDSVSGKTVASKPGFFQGSVSRQKINADAAAKIVLFQYMIGNVDWSIRNGPKGSNCCHNMKIMGATKTARENLVMTPYDFDSSGFVNTTYAEVSGSLRIRNVRERLYRGFCSENERVQALFGEFIQKRSDFMGVLDNIPNLDEKYRKRTQKYLDEFYKTIDDPKAVQRRMLSKCR